jgi:uncharacterized membrane protein YoaK (UPF0700 family)
MAEHSTAEHKEQNGGLPSNDHDRENEDFATKTFCIQARPYLFRNVDLSLTSIPILFCCFCSGLIDSTVFNAWGVFATMQTGIPSLPMPTSIPNTYVYISPTGNTIILALGASKQPPGHPHAWLQALLAIVGFFLGSFFCSRFTNLLRPLRHVTLCLSFFIQCGLITTAAALVQGGVVPGIVGLDRRGAESFWTLLPLPMLSFQAGMQSVTARQLGLNEIPTTVLTSVYCDLGNDQELFAGLRQNWKRNRRFGAVVGILVGGIVGGFLGKTSDGMPAALWMAAGVKGVISLSWLLWKTEKSGV